MSFIARRDSFCLNETPPSHLNITWYRDTVQGPTRWRHLINPIHTVDTTISLPFSPPPQDWETIKLLLWDKIVQAFPTLVNLGDHDDYDVSLDLEYRFRGPMNGNYVLQMDASEQDFWRLLGWTDTIIVGFRTGFARKDVGSEESEEEEKQESEEEERKETQGHMSQATMGMDENCKAIDGQVQPKKKRKHRCVVQ